MISRLRNLPGGLVLFVCLNIANVSNYLYQVVMGRALGVGSYGLLGSVVQLVNVITISSLALQTASAKAIASAGDRRVPLAHAWEDPLTRAAVRWGVGVTIVFVVAAPLIALFLHSGVGPPLVLAAVVIPAALLGIAQGRLQGLNALHAFAVLALVIAFLRLILGPVAVAVIHAFSVGTAQMPGSGHPLGRCPPIPAQLAAAQIHAGIGGYGLGRCGAATAMDLGRLATWALAAAAGDDVAVTGAGMALVIAGGVGAVWALRITRRAGPVDVTMARRDLGRGAVAFVMFWLMASADIVVARHFLSAHAAGQYAAASVLGKAVIWLPSAIAIAIFPRVAKHRAEEGTGESSTRRILLQGLVLTSILAVVAVGGLLLLGPTVIPVFFGPSYHSAATFAWKIGVACIPFALANLLIYYHLAVGEARLLTAIVVGVVAETVAIVFLHNNTSEIAAALGIGGLALCVVLAAAGMGLGVGDREQGTGGRRQGSGVRGQGTGEGSGHNPRGLSPLTCHLTPALADFDNDGCRFTAAMPQPQRFSQHVTNRAHSRRRFKGIVEMDGTFRDDGAPSEQLD
jgi:O-antigen/teichoic acid export membrane protein